MNSRVRTFLAIIVLTYPNGLAVGDEPSATSATREGDTGANANASRQPFTVLVRGPDKKPVPEALVAELAGRSGEVGSEWTFAGVFESGKWRPCVTDADGKTEMFADDIGRESLAIVARHPSRHLVGIKPVSRDELLAAAKSESVLVIELSEECCVHGQLTSRGLEQAQRKLTWTNANLSFDGRTVFECSSNGQEFEFFLPPGSYELEAYGGRDTYFAKREFTVTADSKDMELDALDLPATVMAMLIGKPAPEIADVLAWKNGPALKMADLRGKYVLLEFFGYWCGPCVHRMPQMFALHDKFSQRGLTIIGIHVGIDDESIDTTAKLDALLADTRRELWEGRDLPFPVALVASRRTPHAGVEQTGRSQASADYGVQFYPSQVLIDPEGKVVGWYDETEHQKLFEQLPAIANGSE